MAAVGVMAEVAVDRRSDRFHEWIRTRHAFPPEWRKAWFNSGALLYLLDRYRERTIDPSQRPEGSGAIAITQVGHPLPQTPSGN